MRDEKFREPDSIIDPKVKLERGKRSSESVEQIKNVQSKIKKWANKVVVGGFYEKKETKRKEGDVWEDADGKMWTVKNGIRQTIRKNQAAITPWWCPKCGQTLNHPLHEKFYRLRGTCHDCVIKYEGKMRRDGVWEIYERRVLRNNEKDWIKDTIQKQEEASKSFEFLQIHFQDGRYETLGNKNLFKEQLDRVKYDIELLNKRLGVIEKDEVEDAENYRKLDEWSAENPWTTDPES